VSYARSSCVDKIQCASKKIKRPRDTETFWKPEKIMVCFRLKMGSTRSCFIFYIPLSAFLYFTFCRPYTSFHGHLCHFYASFGDILVSPLPF